MLGTVNSPVCLSAEPCLDIVWVQLHIIIWLCSMLQSSTRSEECLDPQIQSASPASVLCAAIV